MQAGMHACWSILFLVCLFLVTNYVRTLCVHVVLGYPGDPGLTDEPVDRGPEQTDEPGDPGQ